MGRSEVGIKKLSENLKRTYHLEGLVIDWKIILKYFGKTCSQRVNMRT